MPESAAELVSDPDACDAVILHLWQATQVAIDLALATCAQLKLGTPSGYGDAFVRLQGASVLEPGLARRLVAAAGVRNVVAHAYESLDLVRVYHAAQQGPSDLRAFLAAIRDRIDP